MQYLVKIWPLRLELTICLMFAANQSNCPVAPLSRIRAGGVGQQDFGVHVHLNQEVFTLLCCWAREGNVGIGSSLLGALLLLLSAS
jgi:hypothetical protein